MADRAVPAEARDTCPKSMREDGKHSWRFDGDDPYVVCFLCGHRRDALTGAMLRIPEEAEPNG